MERRWEVEVRFLGEGPTDPTRTKIVFLVFFGCFVGPTTGRKQGVCAVRRVSEVRRFDDDSKREIKRSTISRFVLLTKIL